jgi:nucleoid-associated protein YgaU
MPSSRSGAKLFVAFASLGVAFLLAHSFRQDGLNSAPPAPQAAENVVLRETPAPEDIQVIRAEAPTAEIQPTLLTPPPGAVEEQGWDEDVAHLPPPPMMARTYPDSTAHPPDNGPATIGRRSHRNVQRTHKVRDGDTLQNLAQRYLGDQARWPEIFQANRDKVDRPDLLPLAAKLVIPPKYPLPTAEPRSEREPVPVLQAPLVRLAP